MIEKGIILAHDDEWKRRKKIFSNIFNFDMIIFQVPHMIEIADKTLDEF